MINDLNFEEVSGPDYRFRKAVYKRIAVSRHDNDYAIGNSKHHVTGYLAKLGEFADSGHGSTPREALENLRKALAEGLADVDELLEDAE